MSRQARKLINEEEFKKAQEYREKAAEMQQDDIEFYMLSGSFMRQWDTLSSMGRPFKEWKELWEKEIEVLEKAIELAQSEDLAYLKQFIEHERGLAQDKMNDRESEL